MARRSWERHELLAGFALYCETPFGRLHKGNPDIIRLASVLQRSPSAVAMKLCNFAALDPTITAKNIRGLANSSEADRSIWDEFDRDPEGVAYAAELALAETVAAARPDPEVLGVPQPRETEALVVSKGRLVQTFFRNSVLASYDVACAVCDADVACLLNASHIIPWSVDGSRRADPTNGIALCAIHDRAFDRGLITFDRAHRLVISTAMPQESKSDMLQLAFRSYSGRPIRMPHRFPPDPDALEYHRQHVFVNGV